MNSGTPSRQPSYIIAVRLLINHTVNWTGKIVGCAIFEPLLERVGFKKTIYILSAIQIIAVISMYPPINTPRFRESRT
jgi:hypothetical protein